MRLLDRIHQRVFEAQLARAIKLGALTDADAVVYREQAEAVGWDWVVILQLIILIVQAILEFLKNR